MPEPRAEVAPLIAPDIPSAPFTAEVATDTSEPAQAASLAVVEDDPELVRLEGLLAARGAELIAAKAELARIQGLLRDAVGRFESLSPRPDDLGRGELLRQREAAVERAIEAEAARAEVLFKLDELLGHLAAAGEGEGGLFGESSATTSARLSGTVRGLLSARAELVEERDALAARLVLLEHDVEHQRGLARTRERDLAEAREHAELEQVTARSLAARLEEAQQHALTELAEAKRAAALELEKLGAQIGELDQSLAREIENSREVVAELGRASAERLVLREELARAQQDSASARERVEGRSAELTQSLRELRELLGALSASVERVAASPSATAVGMQAGEGEPTEPGTPPYVQAIEGLEEQVTLRDQRIVELSAQLGRERGRLSALHAALSALRTDEALGDAVAERIEPLLMLFGQTGSWRP
ncbi:MAG: hypothetical protein ACHQ53_00845 [Polyangiales bacterium]